MVTIVFLGSQKLIIEIEIIFSMYSKKLKKKNNNNKEKIIEPDKYPLII